MDLVNKREPTISKCSSAPSLSASLSEMLGSCSNANICCSSFPKHLYTLLTSAACWRVLSIFTFRALKKIHATVPVSVHDTLFSKWEFTACNTLSMLSGDLSTASQFSTRGVMLRESQPHGTLCYIVATGFLHLVEPQALLPTGYLANYAN